nr:MAG TPA: hypothetical protein [Caudoviricetes sp.]
MIVSFDFDYNICVLFLQHRTPKKIKKFPKRQKSLDNIKNRWYYVSVI